MKHLLWIGLLSKIPNLTLDKVNEMSNTVGGEVINFFDAGWAIIGDDKAKDHFNILKSVSSSIDKSKQS